MGERCGTCKFWSEYPPDQQAEIAADNPEWVMGACRRGLRHVQRATTKLAELELCDAWAWPAHDAGDWCGEYRAVDVMRIREG